MTPEVFEDEILAVLDAVSPARILTIADAASRPGMKRILEKRPAIRCIETDTGGPATIPRDGHGPCPLCILAGMPEGMDRKGMTVLLGRLRDLVCHRLLVVAELPARAGDAPLCWSETDLIALGLRRITQKTGKNGNIALFSYDIDNYKHTPDWLNPRHWANPQMWDKSRW